MFWLKHDKTTQIWCNKCNILLGTWTETNELAHEGLSFLLHTVFTSVRYIGNVSAYKSVGILEPCSDHYVFIQIFSMTILSIQIYGPTFLLFYLFICWRWHKNLWNSLPSLQSPVLCPVFRPMFPIANISEMCHTLTLFEIMVGMINIMLSGSVILNTSLLPLNSPRAFFCSSRTYFLQIHSKSYLCISQPCFCLLLSWELVPTSFAFCYNLEWSSKPF